MNREDIDLIFACTDSGREGEYIFRLVYEQSGSNKKAKEFGFLLRLRKP